MTTVQRTSIVVVAFLVLHLVVGWGALPSAWGVDALAYQSAARRWAFAIAGAALFVPAVRRACLAVLGRIRGLEPAAGTRSAVLLAVVLATAGAILFASLPSAVHLLGDGLLHLGVLEVIEARGLGWSDIPWNNNAPLSYWMLQTAHQALRPWSGSPEGSMRVVSTVCGIAYLGLAVAAARRVAEGTAARALVLGFLATAGYVQLFAGYAEIYCLLVPALLGYVLAALRDARTSRFPWVSASMLGALVALHLVSVTLLPSLIMLAAVRAEGAEIRLRGGTPARAAASAAATTGLAAAVAWALFVAVDFDIVEFARTEREGRVLPLFSDPTFLQAYRMFSWRHLFDVANQLLLVAPAALMGVLLLRPGRAADARQIFLAIAAAPPLLFTIVANPEVGPFRDWDVFSFAAPLALVWVGLSLARLLRDAQELRHVAVLLVGAAALHAVAWIALNADAAAGEARFVRLLEHCPISTHAAAYGWETLSIHQEVTNRPEDALTALERAIRANPENPRYWRKVGEIHLEAGRDAEARRCLERALELDPELVDAWLGLGIVSYQANEIAKATALFERVVARRTTDAAAWFNLGLCRSRQGDPGEALRCFRTAVEAKPDFAEAQYQLATLLRDLGETDAARAAFTRHLELEPTGARADGIRRWLAEKN